MRDELYKLERKLLYKELEPLFDALSTVRYAVVKGEVLSQQIYGVPDRRMPNDIDILIDKRNVRFLEGQLHKLGFKQKLPENSAEARHNRILCLSYSHQIPSYHKEKFGVHFNVDVNYDIFWGEYEGQRCSIDEFLSDTVDMEIYGANVKTLSIEKAFVQIVLHHYKEMNSLYHLSLHNTIRTDMFRDVYAMLKNNQERLEVNKVKTVSKKYLIDDYFYYMFFYVSKVFEDPLLEIYVSAFNEKTNKDLLSCVGLNSFERKRWNISFLERLDSRNITSVISELITEEDKNKIARNYMIFT